MFFLKIALGIWCFFFLFVCFVLFFWFHVNYGAFLVCNLFLLMILRFSLGILLLTFWILMSICFYPGKRNFQPLFLHKTFLSFLSSLSRTSVKRISVYLMVSYVFQASFTLFKSHLMNSNAQFLNSLILPSVPFSLLLSPSIEFFSSIIVSSSL